MHISRAERHRVGSGLKLAVKSLSQIDAERESLASCEVFTRWISWRKCPVYLCCSSQIMFTPRIWVHSYQIFHMSQYLKGTHSTIIWSLDRTIFFLHIEFAEFGKLILLRHNQVSYFRLSNGCSSGSHIIYVCPIKLTYLMFKRLHNSAAHATPVWCR